MWWWWWSRRVNVCVTKFASLERQMRRKGRVFIKLEEEREGDEICEVEERAKRERLTEGRGEGERKRERDRKNKVYEVRGKGI